MRLRADESRRSSRDSGYQALGQPCRSPHTYRYAQTFVKHVPTVNEYQTS